MKPQELTTTPTNYLTDYRIVKGGKIIPIDVDLIEWEKAAKGRKK